MKSLVPCVILAAALVAGDASAARQYHIVGSGADSCGSWTAKAREFVVGRPVTHGSIAHKEQGQWVAGFLSGVGNMGEAKDLDPLNNVDGDGIWAWIDNYCRDHPLEKIGAAAQEFVFAHPR